MTYYDVRELFEGVTVKSEEWFYRREIMKEIRGK